MIFKEKIHRTVLLLGLKIGENYCKVNYGFTYYANFDV